MNQILSLCVCFFATAAVVATLHNLCHCAFYSWVTWMQFDHAWIWTWYDYNNNAVFVDNQWINGVHLTLHPSWHSSAPINWMKKVFRHGIESVPWKSVERFQYEQQQQQQQQPRLRWHKRWRASVEFKIAFEFTSGGPCAHWDQLIFFNFRYSLCA